MTLEVMASRRGKLTCDSATAISIARIPLLKGLNSGSNLDPTCEFLPSSAFLHFLPPSLRPRHPLTLGSQLDTSTLPVIFTVLEPASILISACMPMTQGLFKRLGKTKLMSYFSLFTRPTTPGGKLSGSEPIRQSESKPGKGHWTKLHENPSSSHIMKDGRTGISMNEGTEEYELAMGADAHGHARGPAKTHDIV